jgi:hypothetical protein
MSAGRATRRVPPDLAGAGVGFETALAGRGVAPPGTVERTLDAAGVTYVESVNDARGIQLRTTDPAGNQIDLLEVSRD